MPQVDLEALVSVCGTGGSSNDRKIVSVEESEEVHASAEDPPQSFWLSRDAEYDWFDRNAVLERKDSTKGNSSSTPSHLTNSNSNSQRLAVKKSILVLPKLKRSVASDVKVRRDRTGLTFFPRRSAWSGGKHATVPVAEPSSPKVSCMGRVRSKRDKNQSHMKTATTESEDPKSKDPISVKTKKKNGFWKTIGSIFRSSKHETRPNEAPSSASAAAPIQNNEPAIEPAGLLITKRFVSGRRSDSWICNLDSNPPPPLKGTVLNCNVDSSATGSVQAVAV